MNLTDELRKLADLHAAGHLSDQEFADAKRQLIAGSPLPAVLDAPAPAAAARVSAAGQPDAETFHSSRWSAGNLFFPDRLTLAPDGMHFRKGALFGSSEEHINYAAVASMRIANGILLANLSIETSGGTQPIFLNGLWKSDARRIQERIRVFQHRG